MKKILKFIVLVLALSLCAITFSFGCADDGSSNNYEITLNSEAQEMVIGDEFQIKASIEGKSLATFEYTSNNSAIASVSETGKVNAVKIGSTIVTVKSGDLTKNLTVKVGLGEYQPKISFGSLEKTAVWEYNLGSSYDLKPVVLFKGLEYDDAMCSYTVENPSVCHFVGNTLIADRVGNTSVTVKATWRGATSTSLTKTFNVAVKDNVEFCINEGTLNSDVVAYTTSSHGGVSYPTYFAFRPSIKVNDVNVNLNSNNFKIYIEDSNIAEYSLYTAGGRLTARNYGETNLVLRYYPNNNAGSDTNNDSEDAIVKVYPVTIKRPIAIIGEKIEYFSVSAKEKNEFKPVLDVDSITGIPNTYVTEMYQNGVKLNVRDGKVVEDFKAIATGVNQSNVLFYTSDSLGYQVVVDVYGFVVKTFTDFNKINNYSDTSVILKISITATDGITFTTVQSLTGSIDGNGMTVYNLTMPTSGLVANYTAGSSLRNISFVNMKSSVNQENASGANVNQLYLGGASGLRGTIENIYLQTDMKNKDGTPKTKNSAIFYTAPTSLVLKNAIFEFPSIDLTAANDYGINHVTMGTRSGSYHYGLFSNSLSGDTKSSQTLPLFTNVFVVSQSINGNPLPLGSISKTMNYWNSTESSMQNGLGSTSDNPAGRNDGMYMINIYASNDYPEITEVSQRYALLDETPNQTYPRSMNGQTKDYYCTTTRYYTYPLYTYSVDSANKIHITLKEDIVKPTVATLYDSNSAYADSDNPIKGYSVGKYNGSLYRFDDYTGFYTNKISLSLLETSPYWDVSGSYPVWQGSIISNIKLLANAEQVGVVNLEFDSTSAEKPYADLSFEYNGSPIACDSLTIVGDSTYVTLSGNKVTGEGVGVAYLKATFTIDGKEYDKYICVNVETKPGVYEHPQTLEFSCGSGKFYTRSGNTFTEVTLSEIFGAEVTIDEAFVDGRSIYVERGKYPTGYSFSGSTTELKQIELVVGKTTLKINANFYSMILMNEQDLKVFNIPNIYTKLIGYYVVGKDITYTGDSVVNEHFDYSSKINGSSSSANLSKDESKNRFGFHGVFDGLGHTVSGIVIGNGYSHCDGFFCFIGDRAVFKNVAFTNVRYDTNKTANMKMVAFFCYHLNNYVTFDNIYVEYNDMFANLTNSVGLFGLFNSSTIINNFIFSYPSPDCEGVGNYFGTGFATKGVDNKPFVDKTVVMISRPNPGNGRIAPLSSHKDLNLVRIDIGKNFMPTLEDSVIEKRDDGLYVTKYVVLDYTKSVYEQYTNEIKANGDVTKASVKRYDALQYTSMTALGTDLSGRVGNWAISGENIAWSPVS